MSTRGRGCQEVRPSNNPFLQTSSSLLGQDLTNQIEWNAPSIRRERPTQKQGSVSMEKEFSFLYAKSSDVIGSKIQYERSALSEALLRNEPSKAVIAKKRGEGLYPVITPENNSDDSVEELRDSHSIRLENYVHQTKVEDPRFTTTSNEYGKNKPTAATFVLDRNSRPQGFSASFNNVKPKNTSLNTSITKSTVHPKLDPQFM